MCESTRSGRLGAVLLLLSGTGAVRAQDPCIIQPQALLEPSHEVFDASFSEAVSVSGDLAIVGAPTEAPGGAAYVFERLAGGNWVQRSRLTASDAAALDGFGRAVSIDGDTAIIGAPFDDDAGSATGSAYVFQRDDRGAWSEVVIVKASSRPFGFFGMWLALSGDTAAIAAPGGDTVHVLRRDRGGIDGWGEVTVLSVSLTADGSFQALDLSGDVLAVGTVNAVLIFERNEGGPDAWGQVAEVTGSGVREAFGANVALDGTTLAVGDIFEDLGDGAVYVFERDHGGPGAWGEVVRHSGFGPPGSLWFGIALDLDGDTLVAASGAGYKEVPGAAFLFRRDQGGPDHWGYVADLAGPGGDSNNYGAAVAVSGQVAIVGDPGDGAGGVARVFESVTGCACPADLEGDGSVGIVDLLSLLAAWGPCDCPVDLDGDGAVGITDLLSLLAAWGPCPGG